MFGDSSPHLSDGRPQPAAPERDTAQQTGDELKLRLQRTLDLRLAPEHLAALIEIHRAVAGHLDRRALFTAIAQALRGVVPVSRSLLLLPGNDPAALTIYASYGKLGLELYEGQTIARAGSIAVAVDHCAAYEELGRLRDEQAALLEINRTVARHLHRDELFATLAQCLRDVLPSDRFGIELPVAGDKLRAYVLATRNAKSTPVQVEELPSAGTACRWTEETRQWLIASSRERSEEHTSELQSRFDL